VCSVLFSAVRTASSVFGVADEVSVPNPILTPTFKHTTLRKETRACRYAPAGFEVAVSLIGYAIITSCI
jgi:hypothetical protein